MLRITLGAAAVVGGQMRHSRVEICLIANEITVISRSSAIRGGENDPTFPPMD
jgi:hypothetical protein